MKRRNFLGTLGSLVAGAFVSNVARLYAPGEPWKVKAPAPASRALADFTEFLRSELAKPGTSSDFLFGDD